MRIGFASDIHKLVIGRPLILGGVHIPSEKGELAHSNGDVVFALYRNRIHIYVPNDSVALQSIVALFLKKLFRNTLIGINGLNDTSLAIFSSLNYISI